MADDNDLNNRTYSAAHFGLRLDGNDGGGLFRSVEGGGIKTDVMTYQQGGTYERWRQLGKPKFEDLKIQVGMSMSSQFYDWIKHFFTGDVVRKNGAILAADFYYKERARRTFENAIIKELTFPKLDAGDHNPIYMSIGLAVENIVYTKGDLSPIHAPDPTLAEAKRWTAANFEFVLDGYDGPLHRVSKVDSFTIKQNILEYHTGKQRAPIKCGSQIDFPQLSFYIPEADAQPLFDYQKTRGVDGTVPGARLSGHIQTFDNQHKPVFLLNFLNADICSIAPDKSDSSSQDIKMVKVDMYTESMTFEYH